MIQRKIQRIDSPAYQPGFLGPDHLARPLIHGRFSESDPFILMMDDVLDKKDTTPVGGPHPHAGFETVSLLLEGEIGDEAHKMQEGDFQLMTAGSGIVHTETIDRIARMRLLQLWVNLPRKDRNALPRLQDLKSGSVPVLFENGVKIKLYSGSLSGLQSPVQNYVPLVIADISMEAGTVARLEIPADHNTFLYMINGNVKAGKEGISLSEGQVAWLDLPGNKESSQLKLETVAGARLVIYAGKPTGDSIISHGPFIADSSEDIQRLFREYREGKMKHISSVGESQRMSY